MVSSHDHDDTLVKQLPGLTSQLSFQHYAGHIQLQENEKLFYWYTESQDEPKNDPIVLWLNGGPGCSSLGGFFTENGPFVVRDNLSLQVNRYSWNRKVNMVWLESPAGVGFSGDVKGPDYYNDDIVALKTHEFLRLFFNKFKELKDREFYITGESYAGMYIPYLVDRLVNDPLEGVNLKGFAIGNPFTDNLIDGNAYIDYYYSHAMVSLEAYETIKVQCGAHIGCLFDATPCPVGCEALLKEAESEANADALDPYFIYGDICLMDNTQAKALRKKAKPSVQISPTHRGDIGACADSLTHLYLNLPEVQEAIHVTDSVDGNYVKWNGCSDLVGDLYTSSPSSLPKYQNILNQNLTALIYSGDADSVVNFIGTERWIGGQGLQLRILEKWHAWFGPDKQLAGYVQEYEGLTFKTVKGAGHMVPAVRPLHGLHLFECFVFGQDACEKFMYPMDDNEIETGLTVQNVKLDYLNGNVVSNKSTILLIMMITCGVSLLVVVGYYNGRNRKRFCNGYQAVV
ncbi:serine protease family [Plasmopara halstedii]|uniref:Carboxypeptidase n=1 Tax=Plasmopara halstedii TaxID=4781 RepID=A0A0P1AW44_PLAHL|nr:serine protease family [Plasmopara halstedii]CEG45306.1 serine protease family [Plasmopara halstedii]|eukprot:XP_024581675.1 serine protease family [Plasmopara halstedii]